jgi:nucleolar pre-ribosomal-associated protein 1
VFSAGLSDFPMLSLDDVEKSGLFRWERDSIVKQPKATEELIG